MAGEIGRERGDALEEVLGSGTEIEGHRLFRLSAARGRRLGGGLFSVLHPVFGFCRDLDKSAAPRCSELRT
jgi:hypothetical protein